MQYTVIVKQAFKDVGAKTTRHPYGKWQKRYDTWSLPWGHNPSWSHDSAKESGLAVTQWLVNHSLAFQAKSSGWEQSEDKSAQTSMTDNYLTPSMSTHKPSRCMRPRRTVLQPGNAAQWGPCTVSVLQSGGNRMKMNRWLNKWPQCLRMEAQFHRQPA